jgi:hypothetical protein
MKSKGKFYVFGMFILLVYNETKCQDFNKVFLYTGPTLTYRKLSESLFDANPALRFDIGFEYKRNISHKIEIGSGISYSKMGYNYEFYYGPTLETVNIRYYRNFIEFPLLFSFDIKDFGKNSILINTNLINQILISDQTKAKQDGYENFEYKRELRDFKESDLKFYNMALQLGITYRRELSKNLLLNISPEFKYSLLNMDNIHDLSIGLYIALGFKF